MTEPNDTPQDALDDDKEKEGEEGKEGKGGKEGTGALGATTVDDDKEKEGKEGKGGKEGAGALGAATVSVGEGFYTHMAAVGASVGQIKEILKNWRHLRGEGLARSLLDFARSLTRASAHPQVEIAPNKDYGLIHNFIRHIKTIGRAPEQKHTANHTAQHKHHNTPTPGL